MPRKHIGMGRACIVYIWCFNRYVEGAVKMLDERVAYAAGTIIVITYLIDFTWQFAHQIAGENNDDGVLKGFLRR